MWPRFDCRSRFRMWAEFGVGSRLCSEGIFAVSSVFLPPEKPTFPNSIRNQWTKGHSVQMPLQNSNLFICFIYLFLLASTGTPSVQKLLGSVSFPVFLGAKSNVTLSEELDKKRNFALIAIALGSKPSSVTR